MGYNTVPPNMNNRHQRNASLPPQNMQFGNNIQNRPYNHMGYLPQQQSINVNAGNMNFIELGRPNPVLSISDQWETSKTKRIVRPSKDTFKEPLLYDHDDIDYAMEDKHSM